jgi:predicted metal-dependent peptidase
MHTTRLQDPNNLVENSKLQELNKALTSALTKLMLSPDQQGNPFLFAMVASKQHYLCDKLPGGHELETAATNGKEYYWNQDFMAKLNQEQLRIVVEHEIWHNVFYHTDPQRVGDKDAKIWNLAVDFVVNTVILMSRRGDSMLLSHGQTIHSEAAKVFNGVLGTPMSLQDVKDIWTGQAPQPPPDKNFIFVDLTIANKTAEYIYEELLQAKRQSQCPVHGNGPCCQSQSGNSPGGGGAGSQQGGGKTPGKGGKSKGGTPSGSGQGSGGGCTCGGILDGMDKHMTSVLSREEQQHDVIKAAATARSMGRGLLPAGIENIIKELTEPTLRAADIIKASLQRRASSQGNIKNYTRFRRRGFGVQPQQWWPKYFEFKPKWVALLDTSGSHSDAAMARGISELRLVAHDCDGFIVPCDGVPYWDKMTKVRGMEDLKRTNAPGRGGTVFEQFFKELPTKLGGPWDVICIVSDMCVNVMPMDLHPHCDVVWLATEETDYKPSFGRLIKLR